MNKKTLTILIVVLIALAGAVVGIILVKKNQDRTTQIALTDTLIKDTLSIVSKDSTPAVDTPVVKKDTIQSKSKVAQPDTTPKKVEQTSAATDPISRAVATGRPVLADFGRGTCIPCKKMAPILAELKEEYAGKAEILVLDIDEHMELTQSVGIRMIPTQIFYDAQGNEVTRHIGFMSKEDIVAQLQSMGVTGVTGVD